MKTTVSMQLVGEDGQPLQLSASKRDELEAMVSHDWDVGRAVVEAFHGRRRDPVRVQVVEDVASRPQIHVLDEYGQRSPPSRSFPAGSAFV